MASDWEAPGYFASVSQPAQPLAVSELRRYAGDSGSINISFCNEGHVDMAMNWYRNFNSASPESSPVVIASSLSVASELCERGARSLVFCSGDRLGSTSDAVEFRSDARWSTLLRLKIDLVWCLLTAGLEVFFTDTDVVVRRRSAVVRIRKFCHSVDAAFQINHKGMLCSGVFYVRPTVGSRRLFDRFAKNLPTYEVQNPRFDDQVFLQRRLGHGVPNLTVNLLPTSLAPTGHYWYQGREDLGESAVLVHYNCLRSLSEKINEMRTDGAWLVE